MHVHKHHHRQHQPAVNQQLWDQCLEQFDVSLASDMVMPVLAALQGHPRSGASWEIVANERKLEPLGFRSPVHKSVCALHASSMMRPRKLRNAFFVARLMTVASQHLALPHLTRQQTISMIHLT